MNETIAVDTEKMLGEQLVQLRAQRIRIDQLETEIARLTAMLDAAVEPEAVENREPA